ncbi:formate/nitrite transporter family protein [Alteribacillus bidgolensis]|uniref:Formate/nitrite transporter n=2 Tax=Alteribacillus bidgolensis TaxID=930129 RepID=A0A1G8INQ5_9BACI|nr:formate/nitrite transporter family protein [Alteribacillus bidgolensis]SDI20545.1 formate/nitrite transporter [Alteribacillus bidgolensis]
MDSVQPAKVVENMIQAGKTKANLSIKHLLIRGGLAGAFLGYATTLAFTANLQTGIDMMGAILFPVGFVMIILLGLELVTGNFALLPAAKLNGQVSTAGMLHNWFWVIIGHLIGSIFYALLFVAATTQFGTAGPSAMSELLIAVAETKTIGYAALGGAGLGTVFIKAILCNWMVALGAIMAMTSKSTIGKIAAMWLPILIFFGQGFEHAVVNMFVIPAGMMLGAEVTIADWWLWNQIPVLLGNLVSAFLLAGAALYFTHGKKETGKEAALQNLKKAQ